MVWYGDLRSSFPNKFVARLRPSHRVLASLLEDRLSSRRCSKHKLDPEAKCTKEHGGIFLDLGRSSVECQMGHVLFIYLLSIVIASQFLNNY